MMSFYAVSMYELGLVESFTRLQVRICFVFVIPNQEVEICGPVSCMDSVILELSEI